METFITVVTIFSIVAAFVGLAYLDKKFSLGLNEGLSCHNLGLGLSTFEQKSRAKCHCHSQHVNTKNKEIAQLKTRIEVLEKIITDPAEQLKRDIDCLR